jgi:protein TonB
MFFRRLRVGLALASFCLASPCFWASGLVKQESGGKTEVQAGVQTTPASFSDFEVKIVEGQFLVRQTGSQEWKQSTKLPEPIAVGSLDGNHKIYLPAKAIKPPQAKHTEDPDYPAGEKRAGKGGQVRLHIVVDEQGAVRTPTVDARAAPEFAQAAIEAVKKWTFKPARLNGQPVAVLVTVKVAFRPY